MRDPRLRQAWALARADERRAATERLLAMVTTTDRTEIDRLLEEWWTSVLAHDLQGDEWKTVQIERLRTKCSSLPIGSQKVALTAPNTLACDATGEDRGVGALLLGESAAAVIRKGSSVVALDRAVKFLMTHARRAFGALSVAGALLGCGSNSRLPVDTMNGEDGAANGDASAAAIEDAGTYHQGVYTCCGAGRGLSCCAEEPGLLGYDVQPDGGIVAVGDLHDGSTEANCFRYGGASGACAGNGDMFDGKDICSICCPGLVRTNQVAPSGDGSTCVQAGPVSLFVCLPCGNGVCETTENHCTCPADCP